MDCFLKYIRSYDDQAVRGDFERGGFSPFTLLSLSRFQIPPLPAEAHLLTDLMFSLASQSKEVLVCRNTVHNDREFCSQADQVLRKYDVEDREQTAPWRHSVPYLVTFGNREKFSELLQSYWKVWDGNWLLADWPSAFAATQAGKQCLSGKWDNVSRLRASILCSRNFAALTFDDNLFDIYLNSDLESAAAVLKSVADSHQIELNTDYGSDQIPGL